MALKVKAKEQYQNIGKEVKRVTSTDEGNVEDPENENGNGDNGGGDNGGGGNPDDDDAGDTN